MSPAMKERVQACMVRNLQLVVIYSSTGCLYHEWETLASIKFGELALSWYSSKLVWQSEFLVP